MVCNPLFQTKNICFVNLQLPLKDEWFVVEREGINYGGSTVYNGLF